LTHTVDPATTHRWVGAAYIPLSPQQAKTAESRGQFTLKAEARIQVLEAYCSACRRPYSDCFDEPCSGAAPRTSEHLRGGPIGERKKRGRQRGHQPGGEDGDEDGEQC
jgi:hypothetical protein